MADSTADANIPSYAELFPELPASAKIESVIPPSALLKPRTVTEVFAVPIEEQRYRQLDENVFGSAAEQNRICGDIARTTDTHIEMNVSKDRTLSICITGKRDQVKEAKKLLLQKLQKQASTELAIPKAHHSFIIGKEGKIVKEIMDQTSTNIRIPKSDDPSNLISISGTAENVRAAMQKLQLIADEKAKMDIVRLPIIKAFHPLIAGFQNANIKRISEANNVRVHVPPYNVVKDEIVVSGEKLGVARAVAELNAIYEQKRQTCGELPVPIEKNKHKFVRGPRGTHVDEVFRVTDVHVDLPASDSDSNVVTLRGETTRLAEALRMVYDYANSMVELTIKVPDWLHRHLVGPKGANIKKIHESHPKVHVNFGDNDNVEIEGPTADATEVKALLEQQVAELKGRLTYAEVKGNPQYYRHLIGQGGANIKKIMKDTGVQIQMPANDGVSDIIRIEGSPTGVTQAKATVEAILKKIADSKSVDVIIDQKFHSQLIGAKGANVRQLIEKFGGISFNFPSPKENSDIITIRGDKKNVDAAEKFLKSEVKRLQESNFTLEVPLYSQFIKHIIGKAGATLNQIKQETDTRIAIPKDASETTVIKITGTQKNCEAARDHILKIQQEQANIVTETIDIDPKFHNAIIGAKGKVIKDIMAQNGGVNVTFPKDKNSSKVTIRGDRADVDKAKTALQELANEKALNSFTLEIPAKKQFHRFIIGSRGSGISKIKEATGVRIIFPAAQDEDADTITVVGKESACHAARDAILARVKELENIVETTVEVPSEFQRHFFQKSGQVLKEITDEFGVVVNFPRDGETVVVRGGTELVPQAVARIQEIVADLKLHVTKTVVIPSEHHGSVVGTAGKNVQRVSADHNVSIKFPKRGTKNAAAGADAAASTAETAPVEPTESTEDGEVPAATTNAADTIVVKGKESDVDAAIAALQALVPETEEYPFPSEFHGNLIGQKGEGIRKIMTENDINIKIPNQADNVNSITLKGLRANIEATKAVLAKRLVELDADKADRELRSFTVELTVDAKHHPTFIGKGGATVQKMRDDLGVQFEFPKRDKNGNTIGPDNIIKIVGYEAKVLAAKKVLEDKLAELDALTTKEIEVDPRVHARIIGGRGAGIKALQEQFKVRVNFPRAKDSSVISVVGAAEDVEDACEEILAQAEEFMEDIVEREEYNRSRGIAPAQQQQQQQTQQSSEFRIRDAPWSGDDSSFPSLAASSAKPSKAPQGVWGRK